MGFNVGSSWQNLLTMGRGGTSSTGGGTQSGTTTTTDSGTQSGTTSGSQTGTTSGESGVITTPDWDQVNAALRAQLGGSGLTPDQQGVLANLKAWQQNPANAASTISNLSPELREIAARPTPTVTSGSGAAFMDPYRNPFESSVVDATLADLGAAYDRAQNDLRANFGGQGYSATAGAPGRQQVAAAQGADDYLRTVASTVSGLRKSGFDTAAALGQSDAGRKLQADTTTAAFADRGTDRQMQALDAIARNAQVAEGIGRQSNADIFNMSGGGASNLSDYLRTILPSLRTSSTGTTSGSTSGSTSGTTSGSSAGTTSGTSTDYSDSDFWNTGSQQGTGKQSSYGK